MGVSAIDGALVAAHELQSGGVEAVNVVPEIQLALLVDEGGLIGDVDPASAASG